MNDISEYIDINQLMFCQFLPREMQHWRLISAYLTVKLLFSIDHAKCDPDEAVDMKEAALTVYILCA